MIYPTTVEIEDGKSVYIESVSNGVAVFQVVGETSIRGCAVTGETLEAVAAEIAAYILNPISDAQKLSKAKKRKVKAINDFLTSTLAAGITPEGKDFALSGVPTWRNKFVGLVTILQTSLMGADEETKTAILSSSTSIVDVLGNLHSLTNSELLSVLVNYGTQIQTLETMTATKLSAASAAATIEDLEAI